MDTYPDTVQAISTALGAVAGSLIRDRTTGAYTVQMEAKWNRLTKNRKKTRTNNSNKNYPQKRKNLTKPPNIPLREKRCMESGTKKRMYITENDNKRTGI